MMLMFLSVLRKNVVRSGRAWYQIKANDILNRLKQKSLSYQLKQTSIICPYLLKSPDIAAAQLLFSTFVLYLVSQERQK